MAQRTRVELVDGSAADETVRFGLDGVVYEIDLTKPHTDQLRSMIGKWTKAGRRTGGRRNTTWQHSLDVIDQKIRDYTQRLATHQSH